MASRKPQIAVCRYRVRAGKDEDFVKLLRKHRRLMVRLGLVTGEPSLILRGTGGEGAGRNDFVEIMAWKNSAAVAQARRAPEVMQLWEGLESLCETRNGRPATEFPHYQQL